MEEAIVKKVKRIKLDKPEKVYNIATKNNNYFANGILVHNCDDLNKPPRIERDERGIPKLKMGATLTEINSANAWHDDVLSTRKTDKEKTRSIYVQQRVHQSDLSGYLLNKIKGGLKIKHICLPAYIDKTNKAYSKIYTNGGIKEEKDLSYLYKDNLLSPERMSQPILDKERNIMGSFTFNAQYMQKPSKEQGGIIKAKWFPRIEKSELPENLLRFFYTDPSEGKPNSDNMATGCWSLYEGKIYIWGVRTVVKPFNHFIGARNEKGEYIKKDYDLFVERMGATKESIHYFEAKSSGTPYLQYINAHTGYVAVGDQPKGSKMDRVNLSLGVVESGRVILVKGDWNETFLEELSNFSGRDGDKDDQVDVLTAIIKLTNLSGSRFTSESIKDNEIEETREDLEKYF